jgi:hypothetical protein
MPEILDFDKIFYKNFEPKMKHRFIMEIDGIESYMIKTANRPNIQFEVVELNHINVKRKLKGKGDWQELEITLYDPIVPSGAQQVMEWVRTSHESLTGRDGYAAFYKKDVNIYMLGPVGDKVEQWTLKGAFITNAQFGELDWSNATDVAEITLTLNYDYAILEY